MTQKSFVFFCVCVVEKAIYAWKIKETVQAQTYNMVLSAFSPVDPAQQLHPRIIIIINNN